MLVWREGECKTASMESNIDHYGKSNKINDAKKKYIGK